MKFLIALPDKDYFVWQMLVQIANFERYGYDKYIAENVSDNIAYSNLPNVLTNQISLYFLISTTTPPMSDFPFFINLPFMRA